MPGIRATSSGVSQDTGFWETISDTGHRITSGSQTASLSACGDESTFFSKCPSECLLRLENGIVTPIAIITSAIGFTSPYFSLFLVGADPLCFG